MTEPHIEIPITDEQQILKARGEIRGFLMANFSFTGLERMYIITAVSELARNIYVHAGQGRILARIATSAEGRKGIMLRCEDQGPGIADVGKAMQGRPVMNYQKGMGLGLSGSKNLADDFEIHSRPGQGTTVVWTRWERSGR